MTTLQKAAQAVLDRWNSPKWEWAIQGPTADLMLDLREALEVQPYKGPTANMASIYRAMLEEGLPADSLGSHLEAAEDQIRRLLIAKILPTTDTKANAISVAALPDLLAASRRAVCILGLLAETDAAYLEEYDLLSAAIANVTGRKP